MSFVQWEFPVFFAVVFVLYLLSARWLAVQNAGLVLASAVFYGWAKPWFLMLMYGTAVVDFALAQAIERWPAARWRFVALSVTLNLLLLGWFKYTDFFADNVVAVLRAVGVEARWGGLGVALPLGISFYTFQSIGYIVDVARGEVRACRSLRDYVLYVSFFPQLVAGPINRTNKLLPQLTRPRIVTVEGVRSGLSLAVWGAVKKLVVADSIAPYVDKVFVLDAPAGPLIWAATAGFMLQIFADFSGYTDTARGVARMLGFELAENFREPFLARTTVEFWQRWHMSLSTWLRDYLLGPLVGDAGAGRVRFALATVATFVIVGFWHGASWNFVWFGLYQGLWVVVYGLVGRRLLPAAAKVPGGDLLLAAFHLVAVGLVGSLMFRERHVDRLISHLSTNPLRAEPEEWYAASVLATVTLAGAVPLLLQWAWTRRVTPLLKGSPWHLPAQTTAWAAAAVLLFVFYRTTVQDFVYFQF
jgi:alginate O-acetyltransferase complex protein AlgI